MSKGTKLSAINISKKNYDTLLRWSFSVKEIGGLCFGKNNEIKFVERLTNQTDSRHYYSWDKIERRELIAKYEKHGYQLLAEFHSHSDKSHNKAPSSLDVGYFQSGLPHLICFPLENTIRCWLMSKSLEKTRASKISVKIKSK